MNSGFEELEVVEVRDNEERCGSVCVRPGSLSNPTTSADDQRSVVIVPSKVSQVLTGDDALVDIGGERRWSGVSDMSPDLLTKGESDSLLKAVDNPLGFIVSKLSSNLVYVVVSSMFNASVFHSCVVSCATEVRNFDSSLFAYVLNACFPRSRGLNVRVPLGEIENSVVCCVKSIGELDRGVNVLVTIIV